MYIDFCKHVRISCAVFDCVALFSVIVSFSIIVLCCLWCFSYRAASFFCSISASCCCFFICISFSLCSLFSIRAAFFCATSSSPFRSSWVTATQTNNYPVWHRSSCAAGWMRQCLSQNIVMCFMKKKNNTFLKHKMFNGVFTWDELKRITKTLVEAPEQRNIGRHNHLYQYIGYTLYGPFSQTVMTRVINIANRVKIFIFTYFFFFKWTQVYNAVLCSILLWQ